MARTGCGVVGPAVRGDDLALITANETITRHAVDQNVRVEDDSCRTPDDFLSEVLSSAADDLLGVYEVWWQANAWYPAWPLSRRLQLAESTVTALVRDGLVRLCRGSWETAADNAVPIEETDAVLRDWATWAIPDRPHVFLFATH
jgi:hypothetical protein